MARPTAELTVPRSLVRHDTWIVFWIRNTGVKYMVLHTGSASPHTINRSVYLQARLRRVSAQKPYPQELCSACSALSPKRCECASTSSLVPNVVQVQNEYDLPLLRWHRVDVFISIRVVSFCPCILLDGLTASKIQAESCQCERFTVRASQFYEKVQVAPIFNQELRRQSRKRKQNYHIHMFAGPEHRYR